MSINKMNLGTNRPDNSSAMLDAHTKRGLIEDYITLVEASATVCDPPRVFEHEELYVDSDFWFKYPDGRAPREAFPKQRPLAAWLSLMGEDALAEVVESHKPSSIKAISSLGLRLLRETEHMARPCVLHNGNLRIAGSWTKEVSLCGEEAITTVEVIDSEKPVRVLGSLELLSADGLHNVLGIYPYWPQVVLHALISLMDSRYDINAEHLSEYGSVYEGFINRLLAKACVPAAFSMSNACKVVGMPFDGFVPTDGDLPLCGESRNPEGIGATRTVAWLRRGDLDLTLGFPGGAAYLIPTHNLAEVIYVLPYVIQGIFLAEGGAVNRNVLIANEEKTVEAEGTRWYPLRYDFPMRLFEIWNLEFTPNRMLSADDQKMFVLRHLGSGQYIARDENYEEYLVGDIRDAAVFSGQHMRIDGIMDQRNKNMFAALEVTLDDGDVTQCSR